MHVHVHVCTCIVCMSMIPSQTLPWFNHSSSDLQMHQINMHIRVLPTLAGSSKGWPAKLLKFTTFTYLPVVLHTNGYRASWFMVVLWALPITTNFIVIPVYKSITMTFVVGLYLHISSFTTSPSIRGEPPIYHAWCLCHLICSYLPWLLLITEDDGWLIQYAV